MFRRVLVAGLLLVFGLIAHSEAQTVDEVIDKFINATGGIEKWKSVQTLSVVHRSAAFSFDLYWKKPNRVRVDVPVEYPEPGLDTRCFDGTTGWRLSAMEGSDKPRQLSTSEILELLAEADGFFWFLDYKTKGYTAELVGKDLVDNSPVYKVRLTRPAGTQQLIYFDARTFLEVRRVIVARAPDGEEHTIVTVLGDYRPVGGLLFPHRVGAAVREFKINIPMAEDVFKMPGTGKQEQQSETAAPGELSQRVATPEQRAALLKENPQADVNGDGVLSLEEAWVFFKKAAATRKLLPVGTMAPDWSLKDAHDRMHRLADYRGKVVVMDFWAVWCIPCHRAMPGLQKLHDQFSKRGVVVLGISTNEHGGDPVQLMKDRGYSYGLMLHGETISEAWGVAGMPTIYVVGVDGRIIHSGFGSNQIAEERRRALIETYLAEHKM